MTSPGSLAAKELTPESIPTDEDGDLVLVKFLLLPSNYVINHPQGTTQPHDTGRKRSRPPSFDPERYPKRDRKNPVRLL